MTLSVIEPLESRIAPAAFFVSGKSIAITDATGADAVGDARETAAATAVGATKAVLLAAGDSLVFDANGNSKADKGEVVLLKLTAGQAMAFFTDGNTNGSIGQTGAFQASEFTGLALGPDVKATVSGNIAGSIDTLLDAGGNLVSVRQAWNVASLTITGSVGQFLQAGGAISNVTFIAPKTGAAVLDVGAIYTGTAASNAPRLGAGTFTTTFTQAQGIDAGDISNLTLPRGTGTIVAGNGGGSPTGAAGAGGDVSGVKLTGVLSSDIAAGNGGASTGGLGGAGGSVSKLTLKLTQAATSFQRVMAGAGGSSTGVDGAEGGSISNVTLLCTTPSDNSLGFEAGAGGTVNGTGAVGAGGKGGSIAGVNVTALGYLEGGVTFLAGSGGRGGLGGGTGGAGGSVSKIALAAAGLNGGVEIDGGVGGGAEGSGVAGKGGDVMDCTLKVAGLNDSSITLRGGDGGGALAATAAGGAGGSVSKCRLMTAATDSSLELYGGRGGAGGANASGGSGGALSGNFIAALAVEGEIGLNAGAGGTGATGGAGGDVMGNKLAVAGPVRGQVTTTGGAGGAGSPVGTGGKGGDVSGNTYTFKGTIGELHLTGGDGGAGGSVSGDGGAGGAVVKATVVTKAGVLSDSSVRGGGGGVSTAGTGGKGGDVSRTTVTDAGTNRVAWAISGGGAGLGIGGTSHGGDGGSVKGLTITAPQEVVTIGFDGAGLTQGGSSTTGIGGVGGSVDGVKGTARIASVLAQGGGNAGGVGGAGGNVSNVSLKVSEFVRLIAAGDGGSAAAGGTAGVGGSVSKVKITGSGVIGDFSSQFLVSAANPVGMGGLVAGQGGSVGTTASVDRNGSIVDVTATKIATILAGANVGNAPTTDNAVKSIAKLKVGLLGGDADGDGAFDWSEGATSVAGFELKDAAGNGDVDDMPLDGLVIVKQGGYTPGTKTGFLNKAVMYFEV